MKKKRDTSMYRVEVILDNFGPRPHIINMNTNKTSYLGVSFPTWEEADAHGRKVLKGEVEGLWY